MNRAVLAGSVCSSALSSFLGLTVFQTAANLWAADVALYSVKEGMAYTQTSPSQPSPDTANGFPFQADVYPAVQGLVTNAYVKWSVSNWTQLELTSSDTHYQFKKSKNTLHALEKDFPAGSYLFDIYGIDDGMVSPSLLLQGNAYPPAPYVNDFTLLQSVNANGYCVIGWQSYGSGAPASFVRLTVSDSAGNNVFQSPDVDKEGVWGGLTTYAVIGPGNLATGQTYTATLDFQNNVQVNLTSYPGAMGVAGYFTETKLPMVASMALAPDVEGVEVDKGILWTQTNSGPPVLVATDPYQIKASAKAYLPGMLTNGTLVLPATSSGSATQSLVLQSDQVTIEFQDTASSATALDALYAAGNYTLDFNTAHNGAKSLTVALLSVTNAPSPPHVANFDSLQALDASQSFTVSWDSWSAGAPTDFVQFRIEDLQGNKIFQTSNIGSQKAGNPGVTNCTVAAGTLLAGQSYVGTISFERIASLNTTNYPAVLLFGGYYSKTSFAIGTQGTISPVVLTLSATNANHLVQVAATVTAGQSYELDGSPVLPPLWTPLVTNTPAGNTFIFLDPNSAGRPQFFYRLVLLP